MLLRRSALALSRHALRQPIVPRTFSTCSIRRDAKSGDPAPGQSDPKLIPFRDAKSGDPAPGQSDPKLIPFDEVKGPEDLLPPGAEPGTFPTDLEQATGLERLEILGKMQGIDVFDMKPLDASRFGTMKDPIMVNSFGDEQYCGCTGCPADSHSVKWITISRGRPIGRCPECGSVYKMEYVGPPDDPHAHEHGHGYEEPKTFADFVKPDYRYS